MQNQQKRRVIIAHGWNDGEDNAWINWLADELRTRGYEVLTPLFPNKHTPRSSKWVATLAEAAGMLDRNTVLVGYSLGVPTALRFLNDYPGKIKIAGLVMVAGFGEGLGAWPGALFVPPLDFELIKSRARRRVSIYTDNDFLVPPLLSQKLANAMDGREVIILGGGHLIGLPQVPGSRTTLPAVLEAVLECFDTSYTSRLVRTARALWSRKTRVP